MCEEDDTSFVLGRRTGVEKFDLVAAGFRDPYAFVHGTERHIDLVPSTPFGPDRRESLLPHLVPHVQISGVSDELTLAYAAKDTIERFAKAVENEGSWKLLYDDYGRVLHESQHQQLFRSFAQISFTALGIIIHPNADHGRGPTDLTLALNEAIHIVEFKKDTDRTKIVHGLTVQLPLYMKSAGATYGSYIVMCHEHDTAGALAAMKGKNDITAVIDTYAIDCRPKKSASKA